MVAEENGLTEKARAKLDQMWAEASEASARGAATLYVQDVPIRKAIRRSVNTRYTLRTALPVTILGCFGVLRR